MFYGKNAIWTKQAPGRGLADKGASKQASLGMNRTTPAWVAYPCTLSIPDRFGLPHTPPLYARGRVRHSRRGAGCFSLEKGMSVQNSCTRNPETQRAGPPTSYREAVWDGTCWLPHTHPSAAARCTPLPGVLQGQAMHALEHSRRGRHAKAARARTPGLVP